MTSEFILLKGYKHNITLYKFNKDECIKWCIDNLKTDEWGLNWTPIITNVMIHFSFCNEEDAVAFKLAFGGVSSDTRSE